MTEPDGHTILIVEDEALMLRLLKMVFERAGFSVLTARDGREAVTIYEQQKEEIALVLSDMVMPKMDGWAVYSRLKSINPEAKVIFTSGNFDPKMASEIKKGGAVDFYPQAVQVGRRGPTRPFCGLLRRQSVTRLRNGLVVSKVYQRNTIGLSGSYPRFFRASN